MHPLPPPPRADGQGPRGATVSRESPLTSDANDSGTLPTIRRGRGELQVADESASAGTAGPPPTTCFVQAARAALQTALNRPEAFRAQSYSPLRPQTGLRRVRGGRAGGARRAGGAGVRVCPKMPPAHTRESHTRTRTWPHHDTAVLRCARCTAKRAAHSNQYWPSAGAFLAFQWRNLQNSRWLAV